MAIINCPNKNLPEFQALIAAFGEGRATAAWRNNNEVIPTVEQAAGLLGIASPNAVNTTLKIVEALGTDKVQKLYDKFYKSNPDKFYSELVPLAGKQQVEILKDYNNRQQSNSLTDMLAGIMAEMSYTVEVNTARGGNKDLTVIQVEYKGEPRWSVVDSYTTMPLKSFKNEEDANDYILKELGSPTSHYSNLTVPGGTNYTENEIATPGITPSIKGHAQFSTDNGIGWGRWDEQVSYNTIDEVVNNLKQSGRLKIIC